MSICQNIHKIQKELQIFPKLKLIVVTKNKSLEEIQQVLNCGITNIGENKVQEMEQKTPFIPPHITRHMIGHLQKNKAKKAVQLFDVIQSVDSFELAEKINTAAMNAEKIMPIFLQVNISQEPQKFGFQENNILQMYNKIAQLENIFIQGIMCITKREIALENRRIYFQKMNKLHKKIIQKFKLYEKIFELSMGMSEDYNMALKEGSTMIRVGRKIFEAE